MDNLDSRNHCPASEWYCGPSFDFELQPSLIYVQVLGFCVNRDVGDNLSWVRHIQQSYSVFWATWHYILQSDIDHSNRLIRHWTRIILKLLVQKWSHSETDLVSMSCIPWPQRLIREQKDGLILDIHLLLPFLMITAPSERKKPRSLNLWTAGGWRLWVRM